MFLNGFHSATVVLFVIVKTAYRHLKFNKIHISKMQQSDISPIFLCFTD